MKKILILGATGMLGSEVFNVLKDKYKLVLAVRNIEKINLLEESFGGTKKHEVFSFDVENVYKDFLMKKGDFAPYLKNFINMIGDIDYVINAIGVTIPFSLKNPEMTFFINGAFPHILANNFGEKLIHITTDCVYNGKSGYPYNEVVDKSPIDLYGLSKSLGEPINCLTLRTSIIGRELDGHTGLLDWFLTQGDREINGFSEHYWNGITTKQFGKICDKIISNPEEYPKSGLYHIFSNSVSKYDMLLKFKDRFGLNCIIKKDTENKLNRTLSSIYPLCSDLEIPSFDEMLKEI